MDNDSKIQRAQARKINRVKDHLRRRHRGHKLATDAGHLSREEFQKQFPYLPLKAWYLQRRITGGYCDF